MSTVPAGTPASTVEGSSRVIARVLELAKKLGATHAVLAGDKDVVAEVRRICPPNGVDYAVDCTGVPKVIRDMIDCLGTRGRAATVGAPGFGKTVSIDVMEHLTYGKEYVGCVEGDSLPSKVSSWRVCWSRLSWFADKRSSFRI